MASEDVSDEIIVRITTWSVYWTMSTKMRLFFYVGNYFVHYKEAMVFVGNYFVQLMVYIGLCG